MIDGNKITPHRPSSPLDLGFQFLFESVVNPAGREVVQEIDFPVSQSVESTFCARGHWEERKERRGEGEECRELMRGCEGEEREVRDRIVRKREMRDERRERLESEGE